MEVPVGVVVHFQESHAFFTWADKIDKMSLQGYPQKMYHICRLLIWTTFKTCIEETLELIFSESSWSWFFTSNIPGEIIIRLVIFVDISKYMLHKFFFVFTFFVPTNLFWR